MPVHPETVPLRSGTTAEWAATTLILGLGELGLNVTTGDLKAGDGTSAFADLSTLSGDGAMLDGPTYTLEYTAGTQPIPENVNIKIPFDTLSEGVSSAGSNNYHVPDGFYMATYDFEPTQPDEDRWGAVRLLSGSNVLIINPVPLSSEATTVNGYHIGGRVPFVVSGGLISVQVFAKSAAGTGDPLTLEYASLELQQVG